MKVIDNFLPQEEHELIKDTMLSNNFPWYFSNHVISKDLLCTEQENYQFGHSFYYEFGFRSEHAQMLLPILQKLNPSAITRIKGNLLPRSEKTIEHGYHLDNEASTSAAIYYINTNNGYTKFKEGGKIDSVANRLVLFNTSEYHTGATCTDEKVRVLINFNYYS